MKLPSSGGKTVSMRYHLFQGVIVDGDGFSHHVWRIELIYKFLKNNYIKKKNIVIQSLLSSWKDFGQANSKSWNLIKFNLL